MPTKLGVNLPLLAVVIGSALINISGFGEHSPLLRLSVIAVALATWIAAELYTRQVNKLADAWKLFMQPAMAKTRVVVSGVIMFTSAYILISDYLGTHGDSVRQTMGNQVTFVLGALAMMWFCVEMIGLKENLDSCRPAAPSIVPEEFPAGYLFPNLQRMAGEGATAEQLLEVARRYGEGEEWLGMCRAIIARNMPESALALLGTSIPPFYGDDIWIEWGDAESKALYERLVRASGLPNPGYPELMGVAYATFDHPADQMRCLRAIRAHLPAQAPETLAA